ncbi:STAS domain-containing protein [Rhodovastum atsumiense]|uniref:STAS domain-containing protein n=2 Tax=Rhodovastum atsumiense TaxID=504468 RepID=A0A5M6J1J0_9PROT|nr:STAS domain-containing protein [Rhodovastum atsumiense]
MAAQDGHAAGASSATPPGHSVRDVVELHRAELQANWLDQLRREAAAARIPARMVEELSGRLLEEVATALAAPPSTALPASLRDLLAAISATFAERGTTPAQTATFVFSLKHVLGELAPEDAAGMLVAHRLIDAMGLFSMDAFIARREQIILAQSRELLELSVPVVPLWEGILSLPVIGTLDSGRAQAITEKLLTEIARTSSRFAVIDISGVPDVDTQTAQHLAKTVAAARLMGAECVITGIRPTIAQVMVTLGIDLSAVETRFSLAEGLRHCFGRLGLTVQRQR